MEKRKFQGNDEDEPPAKRGHVKISPSQQEADDLELSQLNDISVLGTDADHGIIDKIYLKNFMCHGKLEFTFGPNVNFVVGRNGSGKSAIMTALVVGLGGKASVTNRGSALKSFIKEGRSVAEVSIILRNRGTDAYRHDLYGSSIRVERRLTADGSTYKLKSAKGQVVSTKREELSRILDQFNIQVDNPVAILNQDTSRNFLFSKDPRDKYKFFMKRPSQTGANRNRELNAHMIHDITKMLEKEEGRLPKFEAKVEESQAKVQSAENEYSEVKKKIKELTEQMEELQPQLDVAKRVMVESRKAVKDLEKQIRSIQQSQARDQRDKRDCERKIEELKQSAQRDYDKERKEREEKIGLLTQKKKEKEAQFQTKGNDFHQFSEAVAHAKQKQYELRAKLQDLKSSIDQRNRRVGELEKSRNNRLQLFGPFIPALMQEIKKKNFHRVPKGPIGMYLKLKDQKWALGVECVLRGLIYFFCCHDHHDSLILKQLMKQVAARGARLPGIIISPFEEHKYDISSGMINGSQYPSFLDIVDVDDPVVYNCLIDQRAVERILLIEKKEEARRYVRFSPPQNCKEAFTLEGDQIYAGSEQRYYSSMQRKVRVIQADVAHEISETKAEVANLRRDHSEMERELRELLQERDNNERHKNRLNNQRRMLQNDIGQLQDVIDVSALEEEVHQLGEQIQRKETESENRKEKLKQANQELEAHKGEYEKCNQKLMDQADLVEPLKHELQTNGQNVEQCKHERRHYDGKKKEQLGKVNELRKRVEKKQKDVEADVEKAKQISPERLNRGDPAEITREYNRAKEKYEEARRQIKKWKVIIKRLESMLELRQQAFVQLRHFIALRTKHYFTLMLSQRKYNGKIKFLHKEEALLLEVQPTEGHKQSKSKDMRALSGGERSFATVCFIMALWESMDAPFRALDEFDVFMDMINRKIVMELLLEVAKDLRHRQFIFLTPQDMSKIRASPLVRIVRLNDPERNQTTLPFTRASETQESN
ncbi:Structural maintenance of chromosomes protein 6 [Holothuria leucospilota]|uniref:Structural maintenance of chromosomes protein 6 n=1 Tax=Holothuria leucospilota TaxID=206669 RepID=A0A9Q1BW92_HOLLE|nr:Structural maintenance of chromosomes protein 6 [Holothuria leucospilota]